MESASKVQHVNKASSDELLKKFAVLEDEKGEKALARRVLKATKRCRKRSKTGRESDQFESPLGSSGSIVERKSLLPSSARRTSAGLLRQLGIARTHLRARNINNNSFFATFEKTWCKTFERASRVFVEKHYNRHKRLISDGA
ncbi:hypothetical protein RJ641_027296 [Dillenia turbinata]|uniref:Uncharacterized protein n=1 Tax=Dillenia turbinata TaxID=194707 RepID=A0AAN8VX69_9MAGN